MNRKLLLLVACACVPAVSQAQSEFRWEQFSKRIEGSQKVSPLQMDAFGEAIRLSNGALSFSNTDVSLPGNNALPVAVSRSYEVQSRKVAGEFMFGDWDVELPNLSGTFATNWVVDNTSPSTRCSNVGSGPPTASASSIGGDLSVADFWRGVSISVPGVAGGEILMTDPGTTKPTDGPTYKWVTADGMVHLSCLASIKNGTGEGFLAIDKSGTRYWFDWMAQYSEPSLKTTVNIYPSFPTKYPIRKNVLYATRVEDRFGNYVTYTYTNAWNAPGKLTQIASNDGRQLTLGYTGSRVTSVSDGTRTWSYAYGTTPKGRSTLTQVTLPDSSRWTMGFSQFADAEIKFSEVYPPGEIMRSCTMGQLPENLGTEPAGTITHPAGATATFTVYPLEHGRSNVPLSCANVTTTPAGSAPGTNNNVNDDVPIIPTNAYSYTLKSKAVTGPGMVASTWNYAYAPNASYYRHPGVTLEYPVCTLPYPQCVNPVCTSDSCAGASVTTVTGPGGLWERHTYGNSYRYNEGKLLKVERGYGAGNILQTSLSAYDLTLAGTPYPAKFGVSTRYNFDGWAENYHRPLLATTITQAGSDFGFSNTGFDAFARPLSVLRASSLGHSRTDAYQYHDLQSKWVMGQVRQVTRGGLIEAELTFDAVSALQLTYKQFGALRQTLTWNADGTVATVKDGNNNTTTLASWYRGIPRSITHPGSATQSAVVNASGWITSVTDENGFSTGYGYDPMGRLSSIAYPTGDSTAWNGTTQAFAQIASTEYGIPAGHWRQTVATGTGRKIIYFDGLWRQLLVREYDTANAAGTTRFQRFSYGYDGNGALEFESYPGTTDALTTGTWSSTDPIGRLRGQTRTSELGTLTTQIEYLAGFVTRVTQPGGQQTLTSFQAWDVPASDYPVAIQQPEGVYTDVVRDSLGKPTALTQRNAGASVAVTRRYVYDARQQLCKSIEPETASTVMAYDGAGNLSWSASGQALPSTTACDTGSVSIGQQVGRSYDGRNRLLTLTFPGGNGNQNWSYTPDGLPATVTTWNDGGTSTVVNGYTYNKRRMLTGEGQQQTGSPTWSIGYGYDANGYLSSLVYPDGQIIDYLPNALGQPTQAGTFASGVQYHPNGAMKQFTYGNGLTHTLTQNARQLPLRSVDSGGVLDLSWSYDANGNVASVSDGTSAGRQSRTMTYDNRDRLRTVTSPLYPGGASYAYDVLDNLTQVKVSGRDHRYLYDASNRLTSATDGPGGPSVINLSYDARGNVVNRNGQLYQFDYGNRLRTALGTQSYRYDAHGRRTRTTSGSAPLYEVYSQAGQILFQRDEQLGNLYDYVYLNGSVVAVRVYPVGGGAETRIYWHTDALGSQIAATVGTTVVQTTEHEPYGKMLNRAPHNRIGYAGHVMDAATGLSYMQQRYYDSGIGAMLSVDPVTAYQQPITNFCRYCYARNNPYKFTDPDGRQSVLREAERHAQTSSVAPINPYTGPVLPTKSGVVTSGYGERVHPVTGQVKLHNGTDFRAPKGEEIRSTQSGEVVSITSGGSGGNQIMVQNNDGSLSGYAHTAPAEGVSKGTRVEAGYPIGNSDASGRITGPHLHYTYRPGTTDSPATPATKPVDPVTTQLKDREIKKR